MTACFALKPTGIDSPTTDRNVWHTKTTLSDYFAFPQDFLGGILAEQKQHA